jgi:hypothetical protein
MDERKYSIIKYCHLKIGIDLDNTIVIYDDLIRAQADLLNAPTNLKSKKDIADYLRNNKLENKWTEIQGLIYGPLMKKAKIATNFIDIVIELINKNVEIVIISHRTRYSQYDGSYDLHKSASVWLNENIFFKLKGVQIKVFFGETIDEKINLIRDQKVDYFIDDLKKILSHKDFPVSTKKILFTNGIDSSTKKDMSILTHWNLFFKIIKLD